MIKAVDEDFITVCPHTNSEEIILVFMFQVYHPDEETSRREIFVDNMKFIAEYNAREDTTMELGNTEYSDLVRNN